LPDNRVVGLSENCNPSLLRDFAHVVVRLDSDQAGKVAAEGIVDRLQRVVYKVDLVELKDSIQPDQLSMSEIQSLIAPVV
jgi:DNA primase